MYKNKVFFYNKKTVEKDKNVSLGRLKYWFSKETQIKKMKTQKNLAKKIRKVNITRDSVKPKF